MNIAGIDLSTHAVDCVLIDEDDQHFVAWHRWLLDARGDAFDRTRWVRDSMPSRGWWEDQGVSAAGIEEPRGHGAGSLYRVQGAILSCLPTWLLVHPLVPSSWRKDVGLKGNASKDDIRLHVARTIPVWHDAMPNNSRILNPDSPGGWPQDACDAYCIAVATRKLLQTSNPQPHVENPQSTLEAA